MSDIPTGLQAVLSALVGSGGGLLTAAYRGAKRFAALEKKLETLDGEHTLTQGRVSALEFRMEPWQKFFFLVESLPRQLEVIRGTFTSIQQTVGDIYTRVETLRSKVEEYSRTWSSFKDNFSEKLNDVQQKIKDIQAGFRLELVSLKSSIDEQIEKEINVALRSSSPIEVLSMEDLKRRVSSIERVVDKLGDEDKQFVRMSTFTSFMEEQGRQWNEIQRTLGQLEGHLRSRGSNPPGMTIPRPPPRGSNNNTR